MKYFKMKEFECPCCKETQINEKLLNMLDKAREIANTPFIINSGYRCYKHNKEVKGSPNSSHFKGLAVDIHCISSRERFKIVSALIKVGFNRIGIADSFIHCDVDDKKDKDLIWLY